MVFSAGNVAVWRLLILALLVVAMLGPWTFDLINVPAQYACGKPFVRLYGDFCGSPMSGFRALPWLFAGFGILIDLIMGNTAGLFPRFMALLLMWIIVFPFLSIVLLLRKNASRRLQLLNLTAWALGGLATLTTFGLQFSREQFVQFFYLLWGIPVYVLIAIGTVIFESLVLRSSTRPSQII